MNTLKNKSDVIRTLEKIEAENEAAHLALYGLAVGTSTHDCIRDKQGHRELHQKEIAKSVMHSWELPNR